MRLLLGFLTLILGSAGILGEVLSLKLPTASWFFDTSRRLPFLHTDTAPPWYPFAEDFPWYGWLTACGGVILGLSLLLQAVRKSKKHPAEIRRLRRFHSVKRGVWSLRIVLFLVFLAGLDFLLVGNKPLFLSYEGKSYFPAFERVTYKGKDFGITGSLGEAPVNYRTIIPLLTQESGNWMIMPLIPYSPAGDTLPPITKDLTLEDGLYLTKKKQPYSGLAARVYAPKVGSEEQPMHIRYRLRNGMFSGSADGWNANGDKVYNALYEVTDGKSTQKQQNYYGQENRKTFFSNTPETLKIIQYHPTPPSRKHLLGTDSKGNDVLAYLFGGLQVNIQAALFYIPFVYFIGVSIGLLMGYFGGLFDLVFQRIIEALEAVPYLFIIIIISSVVPLEYKGLGIILLILICFGWMGKTYLMRTAAYKEKSRDYVASARVLGASTPHILTKHILPNILSILVTVIPFAISGVITSITSLDYLGFGLPPQYASWGKLLNDGLSNLSAPWIASSAFVVLVLLLTLITFIGEAVREAWDPRKFTTYR